MLKLKLVAQSSARAGFWRHVSAAFEFYSSRNSLNSMASPVTSPTEKDGGENFSHKEIVVFVLGAPGSGKGTQCRKIADLFGFTHICAGDLLQAEIQSGSENGKMIQNLRKEGKIVPSKITVKLLQQAMQQSINKKFIIDGFPRNEENRYAFENIVKIEPEFVLVFYCPEVELTKRLLNRNQGRIDDNLDTIKKRLRVHIESTVPVINYYNSKGKVQQVDAHRSISDVFEEVTRVFSKLRPGNRTDSNN